MIFRNVRIQDAKCANNRAPDIGQERVVNVIRFSKGMKSLPCVIRDRSGMNAIRAQLVEGQVQLNELITTIRSPICTTGEDQKEPLRPH